MVNRANIYMHHLPKVEPNFLYPRVVVHPETGRLYKEYQYFPDKYIIDTLTVRDDLKVGAKFEVISDISSNLVVRMNNLPINDEGTIEFLLMVNGEGTISRSLKNNIFDDIDIDSATIENLKVTDLKVGAEFEVTPSKHNSSDLFVKMNNLPTLTSHEEVYPRVVVHPLTGRLYKDTTDTLNNLTVDTLDVSGQAIVGTLDVSGKAKAHILDVSGKAIVESLNVGLEFGVTPSTGDGDTLLVRMNNLPDHSISITHKVLVINENGEVEKVVQDSLLASLWAKITALDTRMHELEKKH